MGAEPNAAVEAIWRKYPRVAVSWGRKARAEPVRLTSMTRCRSSASVWSNGPLTAIPALATATLAGLHSVSTR